MNTGIELKSSAISFAVVWTAAMSWWGGPQEPTAVVALALFGAMGGAMWFGAARAWTMSRTRPSMR